MDTYNCEMAACKDISISNVRWGPSEDQCANLCEKHIKEVWEVCNSQVKSGLCYWIQGPPK